MRYMLDTNICIYAINKKSADVIKRIEKNYKSGLCISSITLAELEYGVEKSAYPEKNRLALLQFLSILEILPYDEEAAEQYGDICATLQRKGTTIGQMDMLIASHARAKGLIVVTNNTREFKRVPGLQIENWAAT